MADVGLTGAIVPDLPPEEASEYLEATERSGIDPIFIYSPLTSDVRMQMLARVARGFLYCVARPGVTGQQTRFDDDVSNYLARCRAATTLPLALGFGVRQRQDIEYLQGKVEIAVVGSQTLRVIDEHGVDAAGPFIRGLRN